ncbi:B3 domain-containing transcription factor ABI3 isoform X1 [Nymphaea colorata]|nr:B3 domain-containing transcription factor ABI3 isoform X1 [Nymphaea colorata]
MMNEWVNCDSIDADQLLAVDASSIFYGALPSLADLASMQLSSQSPTASTASSSSSSASPSSCCSSCTSSWAVKEAKEDANEAMRSGSAHIIDSMAANSLVQSPEAAAAATAECSPPMAVQQPQEEGSIDVFHGFEEMDILDGVDILDPSIFSPDENGSSPREDENCFVGSSPSVQEGQQELQDQKDISSSEELAQVFFEWLKSNKESISPEQLRSIRLKKSTIESAARRLGGGKDGMLQLLKLILTWVQNHHLQKRESPPCYCPSSDDHMSNFPYYYHHQQQGFALPNNINSSWFVPPPYTTQAPAVYETCMASFPSVVGFPGMEMGYGMPNDNLQPFPPPPSSSSPPCDSTLAHEPASWPQSHHFYADPVMGFPHNGANNGNGYNQMTQHPADCMSKSATKEARKKRMARQRRFCFHHRHQHAAEKAAVMATGSDANTGNGGNQTNWMTWSSSPPKSSADGPVSRKQTPLERQTPLDRRQGWKTEKNLRFLLQKVLKQSDVGNLGRIVLPKKEAETHLPQLEARDGISIAMEDIGTSRVWNMRYRFWPNNKSRMYLLENTGDFVRSNGLQEGDFIVIYSDVKCSKYMIRGVKVPRQGASKTQSKGQRLPSPQRSLDHA